MKDNTQQCVLPVVLQNLPPAETLNQVVDNLNFLCQIIDEAFDAISNSINEERSKISSISKRVNEAQTKTDLIAKYPNKATTVHSFSVYPMNTLNDDDPLIVKTEPPKQLIRPKYKLSIDQRLQRPPNTDTLTLFHSLTEKTTYRHEEQPQGLGRLPSWVESVSDCLLFNTDENPYLKYESLDNLEGEEGKQREVVQQGIHAAPISIQQRSTLMDVETYDIAYRPELGDVPVFNVPTTLSGLGGNLALDITWSGHKFTQQKIAPSSVSFGNLPSLEILPGLDQIDNMDDLGKDDNIAPPPPVHTPPPPQIPVNNTPSNNISNTQPSNINTQPSNITPNIIESKPSDHVDDNNDNESKPSITSPDANRFNLLNAIREGKALKKSNNSDRKKERKSAKIPPKPQPVSLMDHLKEKLQLRNQLMRGQTSEMNKDLDNINPPKLDEQDEKKDKTGLDLNNIPRHMSTYALADANEESSADNNDWNED